MQSRDGLSQQGCRVVTGQDRGADRELHQRHALGIAVMGGAAECDRVAPLPERPAAVTSSEGGVACVHHDRGVERSVVERFGVCSSVGE